MAERDVRIVDAQLLASLTQGNAFFASTSAIGIGGLAAMIGSGDKVQGLFERLPYAAQATVVVWELKLVLLITIFIYAFFKFAWAFRLSHYAAIMIGATPIADGSNRIECDDHASRTAQLVGIAAEHSNGGLRAFYYAIAALGVVLSPARVHGRNAVGARDPDAARFLLAVSAADLRAQRTSPKETGRADQPDPEIVVVRRRSAELADELRAM